MIFLTFCDKNYLNYQLHKYTYLKKKNICGRKMPKTTLSIVLNGLSRPAAGSIARISEILLYTEML